MFIFKAAKKTMKNLLKAPYNRLILSALLIYLITAYFSIGYYHPDEHFQILEFCNYKLGNIPAQKLSWEFHEQIRPALQPVIAMAAIKILNTVSIYNPFTYSLVLRIISALLAWFIIYKLSFLIIENFSSETGKKTFLFLSLLLGFTPFLNVRFSSENYSALAFLGAIWFIIKYRYVIKDRIEFRLAFVGLLLGFSFFFRFQMAFAILGLGLWLWVINKTIWRNLLIIGLSAIVAISICIFIDWWFYGKFVFTPYNYFYANIIENRAAEFGIEPWWYYFSKFMNRVPPPFSILLLLFFFTGMIKRPKDIMVWSILPFLIVHFIVGHKELRFLFPMAFIFSYLIAVGLEYSIEFLKIQRYWQWIFVILVICNIPTLTANMFSPADKQLYFYKYLYDKSPKNKIVLASRELNTLYKAELETYFYESPNIKTIEFKDDEDLFNYLVKNETDTIYILEKKIVPEDNYPGYTNKCVLKRYPDWILKFNINDWQSRVSILNLQELIKNQSK